MFFFLTNRYKRAVDKIDNSFMPLNDNELKIKSTAKEAVKALNAYCASPFKWLASFFMGDGLTLRIAANKAVNALTVEAEKIRRKGQVRVNDILSENQNLRAVNNDIISENKNLQALNNDLNQVVENLENAMSEKINHINKLNESIAQYHDLNDWINNKNRQSENTPKREDKIITNFFNTRNAERVPSLENVPEPRLNRS